MGPNPSSPSPLKVWLGGFAGGLVIARAKRACCYMSQKPKASIMQACSHLYAVAVSVAVACEGFCCTFVAFGVTDLAGVGSAFVERLSTYSRPNVLGCDP